MTTTTSPIQIAAASFVFNIAALDPANLMNPGKVVD
jgi:hypothetical protein